ncbi:nucleotidyltransferase family protein [Futiania mangrovi]|uniref:Nucleotidyltransferase family protein n=1 Tax=Futiania mangrovi TaxID=2959716 RepID=A0A9J6PMF6_9PROT|nr:nucleotidyltransferase family protein [Futiania mangrovii]MCP1337226.1 nucleotidyltransferase family protein [Futiania mangrovii]
MSFETAMVLAAGLGTRMRPLTDDRPKALVELDGRAMIDRALDRLVAAGVRRAVVNVHHFADMLEAHLARRTDIEIVVSDERAQLLDTGGGVKAALPHLGPGPFFVLNADSAWIEGAVPALTRLAHTWDGRKMDALLLLAATVLSTGYAGRGDFLMTADGHLDWPRENRVAPFAFTGVEVLTAAAFEGTPDGPFSMRRVWGRAMEASRLYGLRHESMWLHVGTPDAIDEASRAIAES